VTTDARTSTPAGSTQASRLARWLRPERGGLILFALLLVSVLPAAAKTPPGQSAPTSTAPPTISGTPVVGSTLSASTGSWAAAKSYSYRWLRCDTSGNGCVAIGGAASSSYGVASGDVGYTLRVAVTASNRNGSSVATSAATAVVTAPAAPAPAPVVSAPVNSALPVVSGSAVAGQTLTVSVGSWSGSPTSYAYQWRRCDSSGGACSNVSGASSASYALGSGDVGSTLRAAVTASNSGGSATAVSAQTALVATAPTSTSTSSLPASFFSGPAGTSNVVPASGALLGLWTDGTYTTLPTSLASRETQLGRKLDIYHFHYGAPSGACYNTAPFSQGLESWAWGRGVYSAISWSPGYTIAQVNSGSYDSCFRDVAQRFKSFGHPAWLRLWWEFNGTWFPWSYDPNNAQPFIDAWRRVVGIFKSVGATNTMFVWAPAEGYYDPTKRQTGYPGDAYVDWVASDGYNWNKSGSWCGLHAGWCQFWETFHHGYSGSQARGVEVDFRNRKPYMVAETGSVEDSYTWGRKGDWMKNALSSIKTDFPGLRAFLYFDCNVTTTEGVNWRVDTTQPSMDGFKVLAQDPYFNTR
jgi:glycosyl hydrolase family 26